MQKRIGMVWGAALAIGLALGASNVIAGERGAPPKPGKEDKKEKKAKPGEACKSDADCDQADGPASCRSNKCRVEIEPPVT